MTAPLADLAREYRKVWRRITTTPITTPEQAAANRKRIRAEQRSKNNADRDRSQKGRKPPTTITPELTAQVCQEYNARIQDGTIRGNIGQNALARKHGVAPSTIHKMIRSSLADAKGKDTHDRFRPNDPETAGSVGEAERQADEQIPQSANELQGRVVCVEGPGDAGQPTRRDEISGPCFVVDR